MLRQNQALFIATLTFIFLAPPAQARDRDGDGRTGFREGMRDAWEGIENAGRATGRHVGAAVDKLEDDFDRRPPFLFSKYLTLLQREDKVMVILCEARAKGIYKTKRERCEKIHSGAFQMNDLRSCAAAAPIDLKRVARDMNRNLAELRESRDKYEHFRLRDDAEAYEEYLYECANFLDRKRRDAAPVARPAPRPVVKPVAKPVRPDAEPEIKPGEELPPIETIESARPL